MVRIKIIIIILLVIIINIYPLFDESIGTSGAAFLKIGIGARELSMGYTGTAISRGASAVMWNPAGIIEQENHQVAVSYQKYAMDIYQSFISYTKRINNYSLGLFAFYNSYGNLEKYIEDDNRPQYKGKYRAYDMILGISYAMKLNNGISVGILAKKLDSQIDVERAFTFALDAGVKYKINNKVKFGIIFQNLGLSYKFVSISDPLPFIVKTGISYKLKIKESVLLGTLDICVPYDKVPYANVGVEYGITSEFFVRGGYRINYYKGFSSILMGITGGLGYKYKFIELAYSYMHFQEFAENNIYSGIHQITFKVDF